MILRLVRAAALLAALTIAAVTGWTLLWPIGPVAEAPEAEAILCLGGGMDRDGTLHAATSRRAQTCAALYLAGKAPIVVMSSAGYGGPTGAAQMGAVAADMGVPPEAILLEDRARSTLQNALFSRRLLPDAGPVIVVTEAFHLPRSWASARWAGFGPVHLVASERNGADRGRMPQARMILREAAAIWFNLGRAAAYSAAGLAGVPEDSRVPWLH